MFGCENFIKSHDALPKDNRAHVNTNNYIKYWNRGNMVDGWNNQIEMIGVKQLIGVRKRVIMKINWVEFYFERKQFNKEAR